MRRYFISEDNTGNTMLAMTFWENIYFDHDGSYAPSLCYTHLRGIDQEKQSHFCREEPGVVLQIHEVVDNSKRIKVYEICIDLTKEGESKNLPPSQKEKKGVDYYLRIFIPPSAMTHIIII